MMRWVLTLGLLLLLLSATALAVSCYECDSVNDSNCGDDFQPDDIATTDCDSMELPEELRPFYLQRPDTACLTKYYKGSTDESLFVRRSCAFGDLSVCDEQPDSVMPQLNFLGCVFCHKDLCNLSTRSTFASSSIMGVILVFRALFIN
ncbi:GH10594 [Drosophila grimshawi]|uniref:GH10594 n=2 Tax=Drosophila grimshawi TaxID=7222 RepID=B4JD89_DROGR|nr:GH10594 [Drosophila grimshawi]